MDTIINQEFNSEEELEQYLLDTKSIILNDRFSYIDMSKFLRKDLSLNIELIEIGVRLAVRRGSEFLIINPLDSYFKERGVSKKSQKNLEETFITSLVNNLFELFKLEKDVIDENI